MAEENISQAFRLKNIDKTRNYLIEEIIKKYKKIFTTLNYIEHFLILASTIIGCISISAFASLIDIPIGITSPAIGLKICAITTGIKKDKSTIKKKKKKHDKMKLLAKSKINNIEILTSKALIDSIIIYDEFTLINNALKEFEEMKEEIKT